MKYKIIKGKFFLKKHGFWGIDIELFNRMLWRGLNVFD